MILALVWLILSPLWLYMFSSIQDTVLENRAYITVLGIAALAAWAAERSPWAVAFLVILYAIRTIQRNRSWTSQLRIWTQAMSETPRKGRVRINYATVLHESGMVKLAEEQYRKIMADNLPQGGNAAANLIVICAGDGRLEECLQWLPNAVKTWPTNPLLLANYAGVLMTAGRLDEAKMVLVEALRLDPRSPIALQNIAELEAQERRMSESVQALQVRPVQSRMKKTSRA